MTLKLHMAACMWLAALVQIGFLPSATLAATSVPNPLNAPGPQPPFELICVSGPS
jgi:hypothetical protein